MLSAVKVQAASRAALSSSLQVIVRADAIRVCGLVHRDPSLFAIAVLGLFGISPDAAVAFSALTWLANNVPILVLGMLPLTRRIGRLGGLVGGDG